MFKSWFDWSLCRILRRHTLEFSGCKIKKAFGPYKAGQPVHLISVDVNTGEVAVYDNVAGWRMGQYTWLGLVSNISIS
jgi:hypothetical protein